MLIKQVRATAPLALIVLLTLLFAPCFAQKKGAKKYAVNAYGVVNLYDDKFTYSKGTIDTIESAEPGSDIEVKKIIKTKGRPVKMNGKTIYDELPVFKQEHTVEEYLLNKLRSELSKLPNGNYTLELYNMIVDEQGKVCAFSYEGISASEAEDERALKVFIIDRTQAQQLFQKICAELTSLPAFEAAQINGKKIISVSNPIYPNQFWIRDHKILIKQKDKWVPLPLI